MSRSKFDFYSAKSQQNITHRAGQQRPNNSQYEQALGHSCKEKLPFKVFEYVCG